MRRRPSKIAAWLKKGISALGILAFLAGAIWLWILRPDWPRAAGDPIPLPVLYAAGAIIGGLFLAKFSLQE